jgi:TonB family protein
MLRAPLSSSFTQALTSPARSGHLPARARALAALIVLGASLLSASFVFSAAAQDAPPGPGVPPAPAAPATPAAEPPAAPAQAPAIPSDLVPPKLITGVDPGYPEEALAERLSATVTVMLVIGVDGFIEDVTLAGEPVGHGFDELALSAARRLLFEPALKGGVPMRARLGFRFEFAPPELAAAPPPGKLEVTVLGLDDEAPIAAAEVLLTTPIDPTFAVRIVTDPQGRASTDALTAGDYEVRITAEGRNEETHQETIVDGEVTQVTYRLAKPTVEKEEWSFGAVARVKAPPREVTRRTIEREELTRVAGTRGDALRTIELLPGVSRPPLGAGLVLIRGSAPGDSQVFLEGMPVPLLYHFGGLTSFINSRALDRIDFYPGNFSARYGRQIGGIIDVGVRDPRSDGYHGVLDVNVPLDSSLLVEGPLGEKASFMAGGRRSYAGEVITALIPEGTFNAFAAPVYYDYQGFVTYKPTDRDKIKLGAYGASDRLEILFADAPDSDPSIRQIEFGLQFHRQQVGWEHQYNKDLDHTITVSYGRIDQKVALGPELDFDLGINNIYARGELRHRLSDGVQLIVGTDTSIDKFDVAYTGPSPGQQEGSSGQMNQSLEQLPVTTVRDRRARYQPSLYAEVDLRPIEQLRLVPGLRLDYFQDIEQFVFDPRFAVIYSLRDDWRLKAGIGVFSQAPEPQETSPTGLGNPNLQSIRSVHYGAGAEHDFTDVLSLGVEGFYKNIIERVVTGVDAGDPPFVNEGIGRIYGLEVSGRAKPKGRYFGFLSYTLMRSERNDRGEGWRLFDFDQTHILTFASTVRLGKGWELGGTFRYVTGNPITPVVGSTFDADTGLYNAQYGRINSRRNPSFNRLDVRVEKTWKFDAWRLAAYLDIQNAYNAENREGTSYNYDYTQSAPIRGLPIIPIIGLRGEL